MVYQLSYNTGTNGSFDIMDGDRRKIEPVEEGFEWFNGGDFARYPDGLIIDKITMTCGARLDATHLPTLLRWHGRAGRINDHVYMWNSSIVSPRFRGVVETLEPGMHQFEPVEFRHKDGNLIAEYFWFFPLVRLDCMDRERTTHALVNDGRMWKHMTSKTFVVSLAQVGEHHVWVDPRTGESGVFVSEALKTAMDDAGITGTQFYPYEVV